MAGEKEVGDGLERSPVPCWNINTGHQAFTWRWNRMPPDQFGIPLADLGRRWRPNRDAGPAYITVERENHGHAVLIGLMQLAGYPKQRIHHETPETLDEKKSVASRSGGPVADHAGQENSGPIKPVSLNLRTSEIQKWRLLPSILAHFGKVLRPLRVGVEEGSEEVLQSVPTVG